MVARALSRIQSELSRAGLRGLFTAIYDRCVRWFGAYRELDKNRSFNNSIELLSYTRTLASGWFNPWQLDSEICVLIDRVRRLRPKVVLEIGTAGGGTLFMWTRVAAPDALLISIDLPGGDVGGGYSGWRAPLYRRFALPGQKVTLLRGDSHDPGMVRKLDRLLSGRSVDFLFIDGDHAYDGVRQDHECYARFVGHGGLIAFHDIHPGDDATTEVPRYWRDVRHRLAGSEVIASTDQRGFGIGVYVVDASLPRC
ncbi:class I SAM-dependent methyltransferase [uncultured Thiodictyon sp.]|jgi:cephalosporin hydroxylase|uniref:CmcI family methyltransferase n=1 Tax=uncultured Thiodictyon sp. TaxID=1846217 RepID=UPI0025CBD400|nr:class I SAM-dependent methyltransferase [uncultured Thiodictyon sp.]